MCTIFQAFIFVYSASSVFAKEMRMIICKNKMILQFLKKEVTKMVMFIILIIRELKLSSNSRSLEKPPKQDKSFQNYHIIAMLK